MLIILFFVACVIGFFYKLFAGHLADAAALFVICGILIFFARWVAKEKEQAVEFLKWITSKEEDLKKGRAYFRDQKITLKTEVTQYQGCISFVFMTTRFRSRYLIVGKGNARRLADLLRSDFLLRIVGIPMKAEKERRRLLCCNAPAASVAITLEPRRSMHYEIAE